MNETNNHLHLILDGAHSGAFNMAADEFLLRNQIQKKEKFAILRFYHFSEPTLTIGYGTWKLAEAERNGKVPFVRRITGGGIVSHKESDLTYAFIASCTSFLSLRKARGSYLFIHEALKRALVDFGVRTQFFEGYCQENSSVETSTKKKADPCLPDRQASSGGNYCFESPVLYDVMLGPQKVAGAGQKRTMGYLLHQGSIAWDLLAAAEPKLSEIDFCCVFSKHLAKALNLSVKETSFHAEELKELNVTPAKAGVQNAGFPLTRE